MSKRVFSNLSLQLLINLNFSAHCRQRFWPRFSHIFVPLTSSGRLLLYPDSSTSCPKVQHPIEMSLSASGLTKKERSNFSNRQLWFNGLTSSDLVTNYFIRQLIAVRPLERKMIVFFNWDIIVLLLNVCNITVICISNFFLHITFGPISSTGYRWDVRQCFVW